MTGATGRIGRMLQRVWSGSDTAWLGRGDVSADGFAGRDCVIALAGVTLGDAAALSANTGTALDSLEAARAVRARRVLLFSSAAIYGRRTGALGETMYPTPAAPYGTAKAAMEAAAAEWRAAHPEGPEAVVLRLGNVAGADALLSRLGPAVPTVDVFEDGRGPRRSYVGPVTLARTLLRLARHPDPLPPVLNVAAPVATDMLDLLRAAGRDWTPATPAPTAIAEVTLDTRLLQTIAPLPADAADADKIVAEWREVCG
ncbi:NAD-dependent epimerase/dehydratase family protein [Jannaschia marina]|uniref:NAD-dependent epimerase/dehydratase family protein n=1 Tax=Jannaschia marina TaxID=2741674 RepID=UPI0015C818A0|nr:NAD-dependent epimerase/dehydratase family protein [Jannaschia marina]